MLSGVVGSPHSGHSTRSARLGAGVADLLGPLLVDRWSPRQGQPRWASAQRPCEVANGVPPRDRDVRPAADVTAPARPVGRAWSGTAPRVTRVGLRREALRGAAARTWRRRARGCGRPARRRPRRRSGALPGSAPRRGDLSGPGLAGPQVGDGQLAGRRDVVLAGGAAHGLPIAVSTSVASTPPCSVPAGLRCSSRASKRSRADPSLGAHDLCAQSPGEPAGCRPVLPASSVTAAPLPGERVGSRSADD